MFHHSAAHTTQWRTQPPPIRVFVQLIMAAIPHILSLQKEAKLLLAKQAVQLNQFSSHRKAAETYRVSETTFRRRLQGIGPQTETNARKRKLKPSEEQALVQWILDLDQRGFPPQIIDVRRMADYLLASRGQNPPPQPVGKNWVSRFINNQPKLKTQWNRKFHSQRAKCEDPHIINAWFQRVQETRLKYGISAVSYTHLTLPTIYSV